MKAMILAAGKGTRIRQVTKGEIPKPMVNLGPGPLLEHTVKKLCRFGVEEIVINLSYKGSEIKDYFGKEILDTPIYYSEEDNPLGTAGGVKKVEERFNDSFLLIYGDILTDLDLDKFVSTHKENGVDATVLGYKERNTEKLTESGVMLTDNSNEIRTFIEKPSEKKLTHLDKQEIWTNGAVFVLEPSIINFIGEGFSDFSKDVFPKIVESDKKFQIYPLPKDSYWHEVGNPSRYEKAKADIKEDKIKFNSL